MRHQSVTVTSSNLHHRQNIFCSFSFVSSLVVCVHSLAPFICGWAKIISNAFLLVLQRVINSIISVVNNNMNWSGVASCERKPSCSAKLWHIHVAPIRVTNHKIALLSFHLLTLNFHPSLPTKSASFSPLKSAFATSATAGGKTCKIAFIIRSSKSIGQNIKSSSHNSYQNTTKAKYSVNVEPSNKNNNVWMLKY